MSTDLPAKRRIAALHQARARQAARKRQDVLKTLQKITGNGVRVTFDLVARQAGVSRQFLYSDPELRTAVEQARSRPASTPPRDPTGDTSGLRTDLLLAREEIKRLRSENARLKTKLIQHVASSQLASDDETLREQTARNAELVREASSLRRQLATAHEDLAAARDTNRDLMTELNRRHSQRE
jgi:chromosome segregation ATPase